MKVLIISPCILPVPAVKGGAVLTLVESLIAQNEKKQMMELTVVGSYDSEAEKKSLEYPAAEFLFIKDKPKYDRIDRVIDGAIGALKRDQKLHQYAWKMHVISELKKILKKQSYDRVVFQNSGYLLNVLKDKEISEKYKGKLFYHLHNDIPDSVYIQGAKQCRFLLISNYLAQKVNRLCGEDMSSQTFIVKNGFRTDLFAQKLGQEQRKALLQKLQIPEDKKIIIFAGRLIANKGVEQLIDAYQLLNRTDTVLLIVGSHNFGSGQTSAFEERIKTKFSRMQDQVIFTGFVPYTDMWMYYQLADVAVLPSMWEEPAGLTMIEAAAGGVPVISTVSGGIPEYLNDELAILVERDEQISRHLAQAVQSVFENPEEWTVRTSQAAQYVHSHFSENAFYRSFVEAIQQQGGEV